jgi:CRISPR system Cascade subunit CasB
MPPYYWQRYTDGTGSWAKGEPPPGHELAALRRGLGREPGTVPAMWPYYTTLSGDGRVSAELQAEHCALALFSVHQQSQARPMHLEGIGLGTAMRALRNDEKYSAEAVDRRFAAAATATSFVEIAAHLRALVTQLRTIRQALDYTRLVKDLRDWQYPDRIAAVRRRWGSQYFTASEQPTPAAPTA